MILLVVLFCFFASFLFLHRHTAIKNLLLKGVLAFYIAISILSLFFCLFLFAKISFLVFQAVFLIIPLGYIAISIRKDPTVYSLQAFKKVPSLLFMVILLALLQFSYQFLNTVVRWGDWDAWAIWSQHARFLTDADYFTSLFSNNISWTHPDYPLMLPSILAMGFKSFGINTAEVPVILGYLIAISLVLLILSSFLEKGFRLSGMSVFLLLTVTELLFAFVNTQQADTFLAVFMLIPIVLMNHLPIQKINYHLILVGFFAAICGWIKNEGLVFFALFAFCFCIGYFRKPVYLKYFAIGAVLPLFVLVLFKIVYAPAGDILGENGLFTQKLSDFSRYEMVWAFAKDYLSENCKFLIYMMAAILIVNYKYYFSFAFLVTAGLFASYILVYIITPHDLGWHLSTSFYRLVHQVFPLLIYSVFFYLASNGAAGFWKVLYGKLISRFKGNSLIKI